MFAGSILRGACCGAALGLLLVADPLPADDNRFAAVPGRGQQQAQVSRDPLLDQVDEAILINQSRYLDVGQHTPWQILHGILAYRNEYQLRSNGRKVSAIEFISNQGRFRGDYWFEKTPYGGRAHPYNGTPYDFEGHVNQSLAILSMSNLPLDHKFIVADGQTVTMADMVNHAKLNTSSNVETTWTLWFLSQYLEPDDEWMNAVGEPWSIERLVQTNAEAPLVRQSQPDAELRSVAPCGGCHQLFALALARNAYVRKHGRPRGAWLRADMKLRGYIAAAPRHQNRDGSFSTKYFAAFEYSDDFVTRIRASGHMLEWLMAALPQQQLGERWVRTGIQTLCRDLIDNARTSADPGALYHAVHALVLFRERIAPPPEPLLAEVPRDPAPEPEPEPEPEPLETAVAPGRIRLQSLMTPPPPPLSDRKAELAAPVLIDEAHPDGVNAPLDLFEEPPPLPPRDAKPLVIPNARRLD